MRSLLKVVKQVRNTSTVATTGAEEQLLSMPSGS